jgi:ATP-dependent DNA helicase PIF1
MTNLNKQQSKALNIMLKGDNVFITAPAGTGKTFLINHFRSLMRSKEPFKNIAITSTTGVSAILIGGSTLHSYLGIGLGDGTVQELTNKILFSGRGMKAEVWRKLNTLVIDEVSMLNPILFDKLEHVARNVRGNSLPFGGIQLVLSGDLLQLPVVKGPSGNGKVDGDTSSMDFVTDSKSWDRCMNGNVVLLTEIMRQKDPLFREVLLKIREGNIDDQVKEILSQRMTEKMIEDEKIQPTRLFCLKKYVQNFNDMELKKLEDSGEKFLNFNALVSQYSEEAIGASKNRCRSSDAQFKYLSERFIRDHNTPQKLRVCKHAQVMLTYNVNLKAGLVNGSRGVIVGFSQSKFPIVRFKKPTCVGNAPIQAREEEALFGEEEEAGPEVEIGPQAWDIVNDFGKYVGYFKQVPLKIAYALTIHSCQGSTLDSAEVDLSDTFEHGQVYTALSRTKDLNSLSIKNLSFRAIKCHPRALEFYKQLMVKEDEEQSTTTIDFIDYMGDIEDWSEDEFKGEEQINM